MTNAAIRHSSRRASRRWNASHARAVALFLMAAPLAIVPAGCASYQPVIFSHKFHREKFRLTDAELKGLNFFASTDVLVQTETADMKATPTGSNVILVKQGTPGAVTEVGPNWLRVSFLVGGSGMPFLAQVGSESEGTTDYYLATTVEGSQGLTMVKDVPGHIAIHEGVHYTIVEGYDAMLSCDWPELQKLIDARGIGEGRPK